MIAALYGAFLPSPLLAWRWPNSLYRWRQLAAKLGA